MAAEIDGLALGDEIGRGGNGIVYRALDPAHGRTVAVKILTDVLDDAAKRRFDRERRAMGTLSGHPSIGVVLTSGVSDLGQPFIVMEYLEGGSLEQRLDNGPLPVDEAVAIGVALCDALASAHEAGVLHLDVKPANVLFSKYGRPKLVDFGIASIAGDANTTVSISGTPGYAAPEVFDGRPATERSDIYGAAATIYAALHGSPPYTTAGDNSALEVIRQVALDPVPTVQRDDVSPELTDLIRQAMSKDPLDRPASMLEFAASLRTMQDQPTRPLAAAGGRADIPDQAASTDEIVATRHDRQRKLGLGLLGIAAVLMVIALVVSTSRNDAPPGQQRDVVDPERPPTTETGPEPTATAPALPTVPRVTGLLVDPAIVTLRDAGYDPVVGTHCHQRVAGTDPAADTALRRGAQVELVFDPCVVPNFVGVQLSEAIAAVQAIEGIGIDWPDHCDTTIIGQSVRPGVVVQPFTTTVTLDLPTDC